jgi:phenylacetate-CoA ligase
LVPVPPGFYAAFCALFLFPAQELLKGRRTRRVLKELERSQWLAPDELERLQVQRLRGLLIHAGARVPYYRELFDRHRFDPAAVTSITDLRRLPLLLKATVRDNFDRMRADGFSGLRLSSTSGSSGEPLRFLAGRARLAHDVAAKWRATRWWGVDIGDPEFVAWSSPIELTSQDNLRRYRDWLLRSTLVPVNALTPAELDGLIAKIRELRPKMLFGYPSSLELVARRADERGVVMRDIGVEVAFVTAERLYPHQRDAIAKTFGCRVANGYGGRDSGFIAHECPAGGMHITAEDILVEVVDQDGVPVRAGDPGEVVVTHLFSHGFPFIRYVNGDSAALGRSSCACGRSLPLIESVLGRTNDFLIHESGAKVHDAAIAMYLRETPGVEQFKIVQESVALVRLQLVVGAEFEEGGFTQRMQTVLRHFLGASVNVLIERVSEIAPDVNGKFRYVVCRVAQ